MLNASSPLLLSNLLLGSVPTEKECMGKTHRAFPYHSVHSTSPELTGQINKWLYSKSNKLAYTLPWPRKMKLDIITSLKKDSSSQQAGFTTAIHDFNLQTPLGKDFLFVFLNINLVKTEYKLGWKNRVFTSYSKYNGSIRIYLRTTQHFCDPTKFCMLGNKLSHNGNGLSLSEYIGVTVWKIQLVR